VSAGREAASRYARQVLLPGVGAEGQRRLSSAHAAVVGVGALGCASADLLARAGVGTITLVDRDVVELTNLQRQTLFTEDDAARGVPKAEAGAARLRQVNSAIDLRTVVADLTGSNAARVLGLGGAGGPGVLVDGTDNFETRYLINDLSVRHAVPYAYAGAIGSTAMAATFLPGNGPCLRCLVESPPAPGSTATCDTTGVLGAAVAFAAARQAADALAVLMGRTDLIDGALLEADLWGGKLRRMPLAGYKNPACPCCVLRRFEFLERGGSGDATLCGQDAVHVTPSGEASIDLDALAARLRAVGTVSRTRFMLRFAVESYEVSVFPDARAIVRGTTRPEIARSIYARYVGS